MTDKDNELVSDSSDERRRLSHPISVGSQFATCKGLRGLRAFILSAVLSRSSEGEAHEKIHSFIAGAAGA